MKPEQEIETKLQELANAFQSREHFVDEVIERIRKIPAAPPTPTEETHSRPAQLTRLNPFLKFAVAAAVILVVWGGIVLWPTQQEWWLGPPSAWAQEILNSFDTIQTLVYRKQSVFVSPYGSSHVSGNWKRIYQASDRSREELYYETTDEDTLGQILPESRLESVTWNLSEGKDLLHVQVYYGLQCYETNRFQGGGFQKDPVDVLRFYIHLLDQADRILESETFDGKECVGFEISADKYGNNPKEWVDRIWLDKETKLPVRIEKHGRPLSNWLDRTMTHVEDQFEYYAEIPAYFFEPDIPEGFVMASASEMRAAQEREEKGEMIYAEVPDGLKEEIMQAFQGIRNVTFREYTLSEETDSSDFYTITTLTKKQWCVDYFSDDHLLKTEWFTPSVYDPEIKSFDFNTEDFEIVQTTVNHIKHTYKITSYPRQSHPDNPMDRILFLSNMMDRADRFYEHAIIDETECFGFELSAKKYGTNPDTTKHILWFDKATLLPVSIEYHWKQDDGFRHQIKDHFEWNLELSETVFIPQIPKGFTEIKEN